MKTISIQQPWAGLILLGHKDVENRSWQTPYRGLLAIHASLKMYEDAFLAASAIAKSVGIRIEHPEHMREFERGSILGVVELIDIVTDSPSPWFEPGGYGWVLRNPRMICPIPIKGRLGLFDCPVAIE